MPQEPLACRKTQGAGYEQLAVFSPRYRAGKIVGTVSQGTKHCSHPWFQRPRRGVIYQEKFLHAWMLDHTEWFTILITEGD